jgi:hypothetical protein
MDASAPLDSKAVSFHMPPTCVLWRDYSEFESAYASKWEGRYLSDSPRVRPGEGCPVALEGKENLVSDQLLHPEHWFP